MANPEKVLVLFQQERSPRRGYSAARRITIFSQNLESVDRAQKAVMYGYDARLLSINRDIMERASSIETFYWQLDYCTHLANSGKGVKLPNKDSKTPLPSTLRKYPI